MSSAVGGCSSFNMSLTYASFAQIDACAIRYGVGHLVRDLVHATGVKVSSLPFSPFHARKLVLTVTYLGSSTRVRPQSALLRIVLLETDFSHPNFALASPASSPILVLSLLPSLCPTAPMGRMAIDEDPANGFGGVYVGEVTDPNVKETVEKADLALMVRAGSGRRWT